VEDVWLLKEVRILQSTLAKGGEEAGQKEEESGGVGNEPRSSGHPTV
jgi:hypothetical protein